MQAIEALLTMLHELTGGTIMLTCAVEEGRFDWSVQVSISDVVVYIPGIASTFGAALFHAIAAIDAGCVDLSHPRFKKGGDSNEMG